MFNGPGKDARPARAGTLHQPTPRRYLFMCVPGADVPRLHLNLAQSSPNTLCHQDNLDWLRLALNQSHPRTGRVACLAKDVAIRRVIPNLAFGNALPKRSQPLEPPLLRVAGDDCAVDGSDGDARHPIGLDVGLA